MRVPVCVPVCVSFRSRATSSRRAAEDPSVDDAGAAAAAISAVSGGESKGMGQAHTPGDGWGLVGADGSDEGFGVVGLDSFERYSQPGGGAGGGEGIDGTLTQQAADRSSPTSATDKQTLPSSSSARDEGVVKSGGSLDMNGDIRLVEEAVQQGRRVDTGPCHTGTRRMSNSPPTISARIIMVTASGNFSGTLSLAPKDVYFISSFEREDGVRDDSAAVNLISRRRMRRRRWTVSSISAVYLRRYRLRETAIEVFLRRGKHRHFFVDFGPSKEDAKTRLAFARALMEAAPSTAFKQWPLMSPYRLVSEHRIQDRWVRGDMSNLEYLMALNTISGRSFNDLCQYPVMPWVIADYTSTTIDLNDPG
jgi:hypothetical protein